MVPDPKEKIKVRRLFYTVLLNEIWWGLTALEKAAFKILAFYIGLKSDHWVWFGWVFMAYQLLKVYLIPNPFYTYILDILFLNIFLNEPGLIFWHTVKWFHLFLSNTKNSINY